MAGLLDMALTGFLYAARSRLPEPQDTGRRGGVAQLVRARES